MLLCFVFPLILLNFYDFIDDQAITALAKFNQQALTIEGMLAMIRNTLGCNDIEAAIIIITTFSGDQSTMSKLKANLEDKQKLTTKLKDNVTKL